MPNALQTFFTPGNEVDNKLNILSYLSPIAMLKLRRVSREWQQLIEDERYWRQQLATDFGENVCKNIEPKPRAYLRFYLAHTPGYLDYYYSHEELREKVSRQRGLAPASKTVSVAQALELREHMSSSDEFDWFIGFDSQIPWFYWKFPDLPGYYFDPMFYENIKRTTSVNFMRQMDKKRKVEKLSKYLVLAALFPYALNSIFKQLEEEFNLQALICDYPFAIPALITLFPNQRELFYPKVVERLGRCHYAIILQKVETIAALVSYFYSKQAEILAMILQARLAKGQLINKKTALSQWVRLIEIFPTATVELCEQFKQVLQHCAETKGKHRRYFTKLTCILPQYLVKLGCHYASVGHYPLAIGYLTAAISHNPKADKLYYLRSFAYYQAGEAAASCPADTALDYLKQLQQALEQPLIQAQLAKYEAALADYQIATKLDTTAEFAAARLDYLNPKCPKPWLSASQITELTLFTQADAIRFKITDCDYYSDRGHYFYKHKHYEHALVYYNHAIQLRPNEGRNYHNRAKVYGALKRYEEAIADYTRAIDLHYYDSYAKRASIYYQLERYEEAAREYSFTLDYEYNLMNDDWSFLAHLANRAGKAYYRLGQYDNALKRFSDAVNLTKCDQWADAKHKAHKYYYYRGNTYDELKDYESAVADYNQAIKLCADNTDFYAARGDVYCSLSCYRLAVADFTEAIKLEPEDDNYYNRRGACYYNLNCSEEALADFTKAIQLTPDFALHLINRGHLHYYLGRYQEALADFTEAIRLEANTAATYSYRGIVYFDQGHYQQAEVDFQQAIALEPHYSEAYLNLAFCYLIQNQLDKALELITNAANSTSAEPRIQITLAFILLLQAHYPAARKICHERLATIETKVNHEVLIYTQCYLAWLDWLERKVTDFPQQAMTQAWQALNTHQRKSDFCQHLIVLLDYVKPKALSNWQQAFACAQQLIEQTRAIRAVGYLDRLEQRLKALATPVPSSAQLVSQFGLLQTRPVQTPQSEPAAQTNSDRYQL